MVRLQKSPEQYQNEFDLCGPTIFVFISQSLTKRLELLDLYADLVNDGQAEPITALSDRQKNNLWREARRLSGSTNEDYLIQVCKCIHIFGVYLNS